MSLRNLLRNIQFAIFTVVPMLAYAMPLNAAPIAVYSNDFDTPEIFGGGATGGIGGFTTLNSVGGYAGLGSPGNQFAGLMIRNNTGSGSAPLATTITLANLPTHDFVDVNFLLAIIDSWDSSNGNPVATPDFFRVSIDGTTVIDNTFNNASGTVNQPVGTDIGAGKQQRGFNPDNDFHLDQAFDAGTDPNLTVAHTLSTLTITFVAGGSGWQGGTDESWGLDNIEIIVVSSAQIAEPGALTVIGLGLIGIGIARRQRA